MTNPELEAVRGAIMEEMGLCGMRLPAECDAMGMDERIATRRRIAGIIAARVMGALGKAVHVP